MANHISTWEVDTDEFVLTEIINYGVGDFGAAHPGSGVERLGVGVDLNEFFAVCFVVAIAVEIVSYMTEFDGFRNC